MKTTDKYCELAAFTLIELLVVLAIIAIISTAIMPAIQTGIESARRTQCSMNLRTWGIMFHTYINENPDRCLPHPDDRGRNQPPWQYSPENSEHEWCYVDVLFDDGENWRDYPDGKKLRSGIWQCPSARIMKDSTYSYKPSIKGYHSYAMNSYLAHDFLFGLPAGAEKQTSFLIYEHATDPSRTILLFEQTLDPREGYGGAGGLREAGMYTAEDPRAIASRHRLGRQQGSNLLFLDGHVGWAATSNLWNRSLRNPRIPKRGDLTWYPYYY